MNTSSQFTWSFAEGTLNKFMYLQKAGRFNDIANEILNNTNLSIVFVNKVCGIKSEYDYNEDKFNDDVLIAIRIIEDKYDSIKEELK